MKELADKILVTGGTGMLGAHLIWHLLQKGNNVRAIKRDNSSLGQINLIFRSYNDSLENYSSCFEWFEGDVLSYEALERAAEGIDYVYHCAAIVSFSKKPRRVHDINIRGTQNVVFSALKNNVKKLCFVSSIAALGKPEKGELVSENSTWNDADKHSVYAETKYLSEDVVWQIIKKGLNAVIVNPGVILGVADESNNSMKIFSSTNNGMPFYTNGGSGYVSVQDVCEAMIQLTESNISAERFSLVSENLSNRELLNMIADKLGKRRPFIKGTKLLLYPIAVLIEFFAFLLKSRSLIDRGTVKVVLRRSYYSSEKIKKALNFKFTPIKDCVNDVCLFMMKNQ